MGGVTSKNIESFKSLGYKGLGVLGGIWNSNTPVETFKKINRYFE
jgi:thiamine-phosphate pyrophosphorylase